MFDVTVRLPRVTAQKVQEMRATYPSLETVDIPIIHSSKQAGELAMDYANNVLFKNKREYAHTVLNVEEAEGQYIVTLDASDY